MTHLPGGILKRLPVLATTLALGAAACVPLKVTQVPVGPAATGATGANRVTPGGSKPATTASPAPAAAPLRASPPPGLLPAEALASPSPTPSASPTPRPTPLPSAPTGLTAAHQALKPVLEKKLLNIAKVGFSQAQAGIISNNGAGLLANNGAGIISNNGGGIISNNGAGYRVAQSGDSISFEALTGEELTFDHVWPDDRRYRVFRPAGATDYMSYRQVYTTPTGTPVKEIYRKVSELLASGGMKVFDEAQIKQADDGRLLAKFAYSAVNGEDGNMLTLKVKPNASRWKDDKAGVHIEIVELEMNYGTSTGAFRYAYPLLGQVDVGTMKNLRKGADGKVSLNLMDPFESNDGESRQETTAGELLYTRKVETTGESRVSTYDLQGGIVMRLDKKDGPHETGALVVDGKTEAEVKLERRADGSRIFVVTFPEDREHPIVIGYGIVDSAAVPSPTPAPPSWKVTTVAGAAEAGTTNGAGTVARFKSLTAIVPSRATPDRFYLVDSGNHLIRTMDVAADGGLTFATYAGTGVAGKADGPRAAATFTTPFGLAVDTDDTLYVSESAGHRIRKIAPDGTVSTLAGSGNSAYLNGKGTAASFASPTGLALGADKTLYVAEFGTHLIRTVAPDGTVATLAGGPVQSGHVDATGTAARFNRPIALAIDGTGNLIVADRDNFRLRQVTPAGVVTTLGGSTDTTRFFWDGEPLAFAIGYPRALTFDATGRLFVGATNVRMRRTDGRFTSYAGLHLTGHMDGQHDAVYFSNIQGLAFGPKGVLYVADGTRLRAITPPAATP